FARALHHPTRWGGLRKPHIGNPGDRKAMRRAVPRGRRPPATSVDSPCGEEPEIIADDPNFLKRGVRAWRAAPMIAWLVRAILAGELLASLAAGWWLSSSLGWPPWAAFLGAAALPLLLHAVVIGLQSLGGAWHRARFAGEAGGDGLPLPAALRAWLG